MTIDIYRTGYSRYMGRGVWEEFYSPFSEYVVKKVEKSSLEINMDLIPHLRQLCEIEEKGLQDRIFALRNFINGLEDSNGNK